MKAKEYDLSIRCFFETPMNYTTHRRTMKLKDLEMWLDAYRLTHPHVTAFTVKIWEDEKNEASE